LADHSGARQRGPELTRRYAKLFSSPLFIGLSLLLLAALVRFVGIGDAALRTDEIYHLLAGRSWADHGTLAMGDGVYTRARLYSMATGWFFEMFGPTPAVGRSLAAVAGILLVVATGLWARRQAEPLAGWTAGLLLCFSYTSITIAQFARFYTWHALTVFLLAITVYALVTQLRTLGIRRLVLLAVVAFLTLLISIHLQATTFLMALGLGAWAGLYLLFTGQLAFIIRSRVWTALAGGAVLLGIVVLWVARPILWGMWRELRDAAAWSHENRDNFLFYVDLLGHQHSWLFYLLPIAAIIAWRRYRDLTFFCVIVIVVCLGLHSVAGMKALRYIYYLFPFMFVIWGCAVAVAGPPVVRYLVRLISPWAGRAAPVLIGLGLLVAALPAVFVMTDYRLTVTGALRWLKTGSTWQPFDYGSAREEVDWAPYLPQLRQLQKDRLFIATDSVRTLYYLDDYDLMLNKSELSDAGSKEFSHDRRTGKLDISSGQSLALVMKCYPRGSVIVSDARWGDAGVPDDAARVIKGSMKPVRLAPELRMSGYVWDQAPEKSSQCDRVRSRIRAD
jgi:hypothetical protein